jgi:hypothetical protein
MLILDMSVLGGQLYVPFNRTWILPFYEDLVIAENKS